MKTRATFTPVKIIVAFFALFGSVIALNEPPSSPLDSQHSQINGLSIEEPSGKRAYTYVSEYKRLPVYKFGIGKRWVDTGDDKRARFYPFVLEKRGKGYDFGLGKRSEGTDFRAIDLTSLDYPLPLEAYEGYRARENNVDDLLENKRAGYVYRFGLGKRGWIGRPEAIFDRKKPSEELLHRLNLALEKREAEDSEDESTQ